MQTSLFEISSSTSSSVFSTFDTRLPERERIASETHDPPRHRRRCVCHRPLRARQLLGLAPTMKGCLVFDPPGGRLSDASGRHRGGFRFGFAVQFPRPDLRPGPGTSDYPNRPPGRRVSRHRNSYFWRRGSETNARAGCRWRLFDSVSNPPRDRSMWPMPKVGSFEKCTVPGVPGEAPAACSRSNLLCSVKVLRVER